MIRHFLDTSIIRYICVVFNKENHNMEKTKKKPTAKELLRVDIQVYLHDLVLARYKLDTIKHIYMKDDYSNFLLFEMDTGNSEKDKDRLIHTLKTKYNFESDSINILINGYGIYYVVICFNKLFQNKTLQKRASIILESVGVDNVDILPSTKGEQIDSNTKAKLIGDDFVICDGWEWDWNAPLFHFDDDYDEIDEMMKEIIKEENNTGSKLIKRVNKMLRVKLLPSDENRREMTIKTAKVLRNRGDTQIQAIKQIVGVLENTNKVLPQLIDISENEIQPITADIVAKVYSETIVDDDGKLKDTSLIWTPTEINAVLSIKKLHLKKFYYILTQVGKQYANFSDGVFNQTYDQLSRRGANANRGILLEYSKELKKKGYLERFEHGTWNSEEGKYFPNRYKLAQPKNTPPIAVEDVLIPNGKTIQFENWLWYLHENNYIDLRNDRRIISRSHFFDMQKERNNRK